MPSQTQGSLKQGKKPSRVLAYVRGNRRLQIGLIAGPAIFLLGFFFLLPLVSMAWLSLLSGLPPGASSTIQNYKDVFSGANLEILRRTLWITLQTTVIVSVAGYALAYSAVRFSKRTTLILLLVILPYWTNYIIRMFAWVTILQKGGVLSTLLNAANLINGPHGFLYTREAVLIGFTYIWLPLAVLPFYASIRNMDEALIEAAKDLGSGPIKTFFTITVPMTLEGIITGVILVAIPTFGSFITPVMLGGSNVVMIGMVIERQFNSAFNWPLGSALGIVVGIFVVLCLLGAVKIGAGGGLFGAQESDGK